MRDAGGCEVVFPFLRKLSQAGAGRPIDRRTRGFMEARFGRDFSEVRVHTGAAATEAANALRARAFTMGDQIVFSERQFDPHTPAGLRLLAHELAHVAQQEGRGPGEPGEWRLGEGHGPFEDEAELVADRVLSGGALPAITADPGGFIRRVVRPDISSTRITIHPGPGQQVPRAPSPQNNHANDADFTCGTVNAAGNPTVACISADASVQVNGAAGDSLLGWTFGFIQVQWIETNWGHYRGRLNNHGSLFLQRARPPGRRNQACRDTIGAGTAGNFFYDPAFTTAPFPPGPAAFPAVINVPGWNDTPGDFYRLRELNSTTGQTNFLREVQLEFHFLTVYSARDPFGAFIHLAHFYWNVHWQARFSPANFTNLTLPWHVRLIPGGNARNIGPVHQGIPTATNARERAMIAALNDATLVNNCNDIAGTAATSVDPVPDTPAPLGPPAIAPGANRREDKVWHNFVVTS